MAIESIDVLIEGGKATAAPPLGPALGPMGVNIGEVVAEINKKTADFKGMKVPVTVNIDKDSKEFTIDVGTPPAAQLIKTEAGIQKASGNPKKEHIADIKIQQAMKIANLKESSLLGADMKARVKEIIGTCNTMGIKVEGMHANDAIAAINEGKFDDIIASGKTELSAEELKKLEEEKKQLRAELAEKHAREERLANEMLERSGGDAAKARKLMEEAGISNVTMDKVAPLPKEEQKQA